MPYKICETCGESFFHDHGEGWKTVCVGCFKRKKSAERGGYDPDQVVVDRLELAKLRRDAEFYRGMYFTTLAERNEYRPTSGLNILEKLKPLISDLLFLAHPDKHGGSDPRATRATQALLDLRREVSA